MPPKRQRHERLPAADLAPLDEREELEADEGLEDFDDFIKNYTQT